MVPFGIPGMDANDNKPKGKMTAYAFFVQICRDEHKRKHPDEQVCTRTFVQKYIGRIVTICLLTKIGVCKKNSIHCFDFQVSLTEFTKKCSERWKTMTEKEKRRFNQMADADKKVIFIDQNYTSIQ